MQAPDCYGDGDGDGAVTAGVTNDGFSMVNAHHHFLPFWVCVRVVFSLSIPSTIGDHHSSLCLS